MTPHRQALQHVAPFLQASQLAVVQRKELLELFGYESRNKYSIHTPDGAEVAFCAEQGKGFWDVLLRQFLGHARSFQLHVFNHLRQPIFIAEHPFRWYFTRLTIKTPEGEVIGAIQRRWGWFSKVFDVVDANDRVLLSVASPFWRIWTFRFMRADTEFARVEKKWAGFVLEAFTDADRFGVTFAPTLGADERALVLLAAIYIDLVYFETNANNH